MWCDECGAGPFQRACDLGSHNHHAHQTIIPCCADRDCQELAVRNGWCERHDAQVRRRAPTYGPPDETWRRLAACRGHTDPFFPDNPYIPGAYTAARAICARCPVIEPCAAYSVPQVHLHGLWAGMGPRERKRLRATRQAWEPYTPCWEHDPMLEQEWDRRDQRAANERVAAEDWSELDTREVAA